MNDPILEELRREAAAWHLRNTAKIYRTTIETIDGRDETVETLVYEGPIGIVRRANQGVITILAELPYEAPVMLPGDVIHLDDDRVYPVLIIQQYMPATEMRALNKAVCETRSEVYSAGIQ